jgi:(2R)-sulfolactate sulfo-lyase subunit alpha
MPGAGLIGAKLRVSIAAIVARVDTKIQVICMTGLTGVPSALACGPVRAIQAQPRRTPPMIHFVLHDARDTVAVVVVEGVKAGMPLQGWIMDEDKSMTVTARQDIPIGHKVALCDMAAGDTVLKYGIDIGKVVAPIQAGEHAHVHNIKTKRW